MLRKATGVLVPAILIFVMSRGAGAQDVCIPLGNASTPDGRVAGDASWNGATRIDLDNPGVNPTTYLRLRRTDAPDAALYLGLVVNTGALAPNVADRIVIGISPLDDAPEAAWRIHISPFALGLAPGMSMPAAVSYWRNNAPGWNSTAATDPSDPAPLNDWLKPTKMRVYYYGGNRWDFEWKIPLGATKDKMIGDAGLYLPPAGSTFKFYFNLLKTCDSGFVCQYPWPLNRPLMPSLNTGTPDLDVWGTGSLDQRAQCGVILTWDRIGLQVPPSGTDQELMCFNPDGGFADCAGILPGDNWPAMQGPPNQFYALPVNRMATGSSVQAQFSVAPWGCPAPGDWSLVQYPPEAMPPVAPLVNPPAPASVIAPLSQGCITLDWPLTYQQSCMTHGDPFRSIQVLMSKPDTDTMTIFPTNPVERSLDTVSASAFRRTARVGTKGFPAAGPGPVRMILTVDKEVRRRGVPPPSVPASPVGAPAAAIAPALSAPRILSDAQLYRDSSDVAAVRTPPDVEETLTWTCRAFRRTGQKLKIEDGNNVLEFDAVAKGSAFGYICGHRGPVERWDSAFQGQGLTRLADGIFEIDIPPGTSGLVETLIEAEEFRRWGVNASVGVAVPNGRFAGAVNSGGTMTFGLEYRLNPMVALEAGMTAAEFREGSGGSDATVFGTTVGARAYLLEGSIRPYAEAGLGFYAGSPGPDGIGIDLGIGIRCRLSDQVGFTAGYRFQEVFVSGVDPCWSTIELGVSLRF